MQKQNGIAYSILKLRSNLNLTQEKLAAHLGVSAMAISRWERGMNQPPASCAIKMAKMSDTARLFWRFLNYAGLSKVDLKR